MTLLALENKKENRQHELFINFYKFMGADKRKIFTLDYFVETTKIDLSRRLKEHYFNKLVHANLIEPTWITINSDDAYQLNWDVIKIIEELL